MDAYLIYAQEPNPISLGGFTGGSAEFNPDSLSDLGYGRENTPKVEEEVHKLFGKYGAGVVFGSRHKAPCSVWRSERILVGSEELPRFANRVYIFQRSATKTYGDFLGYLSLRPKVSKTNVFYPYTSVAYITPPRFMLRPRYHVLTTASGPADNVMPFRASPFCMPNADTGNRASCLHSALQSALLLKMNSFGCTPICSQDMVALLWAITDGNRPMADLSSKGATLTEALQVLQHQEVQAGGVLETIPAAHFEQPLASLQTRKGSERAQLSREGLAMLEAHHCLTDYLANGLPVIIEVPIKEQTSLKTTDDGRPRVLLHSILILGMHLLHDPEDPSYEALDYFASDHRVDIAELPGRFVVHDIRRPPFTELAAATLLREAWVTEDEGGKPVDLPSINYLALAPRNTRMGIYTARRNARAWMTQEGDRFWHKYVSDYSLSNGKAPESHYEARFVTRLLHTGEMIRRYLPDRVTDRRAQSQAASALSAAASSDDRDWWCVEVRLPSPPHENKTAIPPALVYMWWVSDDPHDERGGSPRAIIRYVGGGQVTLTADEKEIRYDFPPYSA